MEKGQQPEKGNSKQKDEVAPTKEKVSFDLPPKQEKDSKQEDSDSRTEKDYPKQENGDAKRDIEYRRPDNDYPRQDSDYSRLGSYRNESTDVKFHQPDNSGQMVDLYPTDYPTTLPPHNPYYHMTYPDTYNPDDPAPVHHPYDDQQEPYTTPIYSDYYPDQPQSYPGPPQASVHYDDYQYYPSDSYRQPDYPTKYHPSPPGPHLSYSQSNYADYRDLPHPADDKLELPKKKVVGYQAYMCWSVFNFLFCWGILGAIAMVNSFEARQKYKHGFVKQAEKHKRCALGVNVAALLTGAVATTIVILYLCNVFQHVETTS